LAHSAPTSSYATPSLVFAAMPATRNAISDEEMGKLLRANMRALDDSKYNMADAEVVLKNHFKFIQDMAKVCPNATKNLIAAGAQEAFSASQADAKFFGERMHAVMQYCRGKAKSMTSGKRLSGDVLVIARILISAPSQESPEHLPRKPSDLSSCSQRSTSSAVVAVLESPRRRVRGKSSSGGRSPSAGARSPDEKPKPTYDELRQMWGLPCAAAPPASRPRTLTRLLTVSSASSIEELPTEDAVATPVATPYKILVDSSKMAMVKHFEDGSPPEYAKMIPGKDGFALAVFGSDPPMETEIPNMVIEAAATTEPTKKRKKKAVKDDDDDDDDPDADAGDDDEVPMKAKKAMKAMKGMKAMKAMKTKVKGAVCKKPSGSTEGTAASEELAAAPAPAAEPEPPLPGAKAPEDFKQDYGLMWYKHTNGYGIREKYLGKRQVMRIGADGVPKTELKKIADEAVEKLRAGETVEAVKVWKADQLEALGLDLD
jgi:hypothetical protein